jgi:hypothetical protein
MLMRGDNRGWTLPDMLKCRLSWVNDKKSR